MSKEDFEKRRTVWCLPYPISERIRYEQPQIGIDEHSTRTDVRARLPQIRKIKGIGPKSLQIIQAWLDESPVAIT